MGLEDGAEPQRPSYAPADAVRRTDLPAGTITFLFTDIEGSTRLVVGLGAGYPPVLERHQALLRAAFVAGTVAGPDATLTTSPGATSGAPSARAAGTRPRPRRPPAGRRGPRR